MSGADATRSERRLAAVLWLALWLGFAWVIGVRPGSGWYSPSLGHRMQTEALLDGTFALQPTPHGQRADWAWGNGSQHVWGLGVGLVRLPFEAAARLVGAVGFPDRVTLLLAFVGVTLFCARAFPSLSPLERVAIAVVIVATPAFITLCRTRLAVYEESVAYAHLGSVAMGSGLVAFATRRRDRDLVLVAAVAGVSPLLRPTLMLDAVVTMALAVGLRAAARPRDRWAAPTLAVAVFAAGLALVGLVNQRRFGSPFETGQLLNVSYIPTDQAAKLFGYPFWFEPFGSAAAELVSSFLLPAHWNAPTWYAPDVVAWQAPTVRFREVYFTPFSHLQVALLLIAWVGVPLLAVAARRPNLVRRAPAPPVRRARRLRLVRLAPAGRRERRRRLRLRLLVRAPVGVMICWSAGVFVAQFLFYLWAPSMTSRYAVDLAAPLAFGLAAVLLVVLRAVAPDGDGVRALGVRQAVAALAALWVLHDGASAEIGPFHRPAPLLDVAQVAAALEQRPRPDPLPLPDTYRCGDAPESVGVKFNGSGWTTPGSCEVHAATMLFLPRASCVRVRIEAAPGAPPLDPDDTAAVRAKLGLSEMRRVADEPAGDGRALTFCAPTDHEPNPRGIELLYLGWTPPATLSPDVRPFRLLEVAAVTAS